MSSLRGILVGQASLLLQFSQIAFLGASTRLLKSQKKQRVGFRLTFVEHTLTGPPLLAEHMGHSSVCLIPQTYSEEHFLQYDGLLTETQTLT